MPEYYAHSGKKPLDRENPDYSDWEPLADHLRDVANRARQLAAAARPNDAAFIESAYLAGLLHDLGKYRPEFQDYLKGNRASGAETAHAVYGAAAAELGLESMEIAFAIAGHHAGLHDSDSLALLIGGQRFRATERYGALLELATAECGVGFTKLPPQFDCNNVVESRSQEFYTRLLFSVLVDADRLETEKFGTGYERSVATFHADCLLERLHAARAEKAAVRGVDTLNQLRNQIFDKCLARGNDAQGFFSLTVPTGGGKTLSSMAFALAHAKRHGLRRVIVVIPYLSIIEQNARQYREIFGTGQVLEHHSAVESPEGTRPPKSLDDAEPYQASEAEKAMENWDVPIVVTTSVQFIESLFAAKTSRARKLHNIAQSVVIFDEVQTLPTHLLEPLLDVLREMWRAFGSSFLFCSATQPAFKKSPNLKQGFHDRELTEVADNPEETFRTLCRVEYRIEPNGEPWDWQRLAREMAAQPQALCVLNLRKQAFEAWQTLQAFLEENGRTDDARDGVFHLSSAMCPAHRLDLLGLSRSPPPNNVMKRLKEKRPCWVVSTQLIEAGVDVDFPIVFRAMGPLDSIVQAGGRCNREGLLRDSDGQLQPGRVVVFHPLEAGLPQGIYERATTITPAYLVGERIATDPNVFGEYFTELFQLSNTDHVKRNERTIQDDRAELKFDRVARNARVIKDATISVIVPYGQTRRLVAQIRKSGRFDRDTLRRLQRSMVSLRRGPNGDYERLSALGRLSPLLPDRLEIPVLDADCYHAQLGVLVKERPLEDFIQ